MDLSLCTVVIHFKGISRIGMGVVILPDRRDLTVIHHAVPGPAPAFSFIILPIRLAPQ